MMSDILILITAVLALSGSFFALVAALGLVRLPNLYARMHAASKAGTVGAGLILLAFVPVAPDISSALRAIITLVFFVITAPVAAHLLSRAAKIAKDPQVLVKIAKKRNAKS